MDDTRTHINQLVTRIQNDLIELRAYLADLEITDNPEQPGRRRTGWRFVRGSHGGSYVRDPYGTDIAPADHEQ